MDLDAIFSPWLIWFLLGIGLAFLELQMPGFIVLFFGIGCWTVAGVLQIWSLTLTQQIIVFLVATLVSILLLRKALMRIFRGRFSDEAREAFDDFPKGAHVKVVQRITPNENGKILYRGTNWEAASDSDIEIGETAQILRFAENSRLVFIVKKIEH